MEKRTVLAIVISIGVLMSWQLLINKLYPVEKSAVRENQISQEVFKKEMAAKPEQISAVTNVSSSPSAISEYSNLTDLETDKYRVSFVNPGARIKNVYFKDYNLTFEITDGLSTEIFDDKPYTLQKSDGKLQFSYNQNGHFVEKSLVFHNNSYLIELEISYKNDTKEVWTLNDKLILNSVSNKAKSEESQLFEAVVMGFGPPQRKNPLHIKKDIVQTESFSSLAFRNRYSCIILKPVGQPATQTYFITKNNEQALMGLSLDNIIVPPGGIITYKYTLYCGPQEVNLLKNIGLGFEDVMYFGGFDFISNLLLSSMRFSYKYVHNWGTVLIILSLLVFFVLYPLTLKQMRSMKDMQLIQPQVEALRKNYKDNPQRMNKEIMELYKKHRVNPLGGCLPMILQIPIFFGLYQALSRSVELKGSHFLWIKDLAEPDRLFVLPNSLPFIGNDINLLPILMAIGMFFQQKISMQTGPGASSEAAQQQKLMLVVMPVLFGFIFYRFPSGLALYWFMNTILNLVSQWKIIKTTTTRSLEQAK